MTLIEAIDKALNYYKPKAKLISPVAIILDDETGDITMLTKFELKQFDDLEFLSDLTKGKAWIFRARLLPGHDEPELETMHQPHGDLN